MKFGRIKTEWEMDVITPSCANLARQEEPCLSLVEISQRAWLEDRDVVDGIDGDAIHFEAWKENLYDTLTDRLYSAHVPERFWPAYQRLELRWRFGVDNWRGPWIEAELVEKH